MKAMPQFNAWPRLSVPMYRRWLVVGAGVFGAMTLNSWLTPVGMDPAHIAEQRERFGYLIILTLVCGLWLLAFVLRILAYRFNRHNAWRYEQAAQRTLDTWWTQHRQSAGLLECVLLGPACSGAVQHEGLFSKDHQAPEPQSTAKGAVLRLASVMGDGALRERQLAEKLVINWTDQRAPVAMEPPLRCYWHGSAVAWAGFVEQMAVSFPTLKLPVRPEPWQGLDSLEAIIGLLQASSSRARILCAGCEVAPSGPDSNVPGGEAAVLWWLGRQGGVQLPRGEWHNPQNQVTEEAVADVAARVLLQAQLDVPPPACVAFGAPVADIPGWHASTYPQHDNFGALQHLHGMVAISLAASLARSSGTPCAWLAGDPVYPLTLGVVRADVAA